MSAVEARSTLVLPRSRDRSALWAGEGWGASDLLRPLADGEVNLRDQRPTLGVSWVLLRPAALCHRPELGFAHVI